MEITKDSGRALGEIYKLYKDRIQIGQPKSAAKYFDAYGWGGGPKIDGMPESEEELSTAGFIKSDITGGFELTDAAIILMENRVKNTVLSAIDVGTKFIP